MRNINDNGLFGTPYVGMPESTIPEESIDAAISAGEGSGDEN